LGEGGVGKTALTIQYIQNHFIKDYDPTIENSYRKQIHLDGENIMLDILDTAGQEEYSVMREQYIRTGVGFLLIYSIAQKDSYSALEEYRAHILRVKGSSNHPIVLIGNKCDLESQRQVTTDDGKNMAKRFGCSFYETSAKDRINVEECFMQLVKDMKARSSGTATTTTTKTKTPKKKKVPGKSLKSRLTRKNTSGVYYRKSSKRNDCVLI